MPDIVSAPYTFVDGDPALALEVESNLWRPTSTENTLSVINGGLDADNLKAGASVSREMVQRHALSSGVAVGATANLDYFDDLFAIDPNTVNIFTLADDVDFAAYVAISGASVSYFVPWDASAVVLAWNIFWGSDANSDDTGLAASNEMVNIRLFTEAATPNGQRRTSRNAVDNSGTFPARVYWSDRYWCGHHTLTDVAKGWHEASLRLLMTDRGSASTLQRPLHHHARVRCRGMRAIVLR